MLLREACELLNIWSMAKARAEVWSISKKLNEDSLSDLKNIAKQEFQKLAMDNHPDKGGNHDKYVNIQCAYDIIKHSTIENFISLIKNYSIQYYQLGSKECFDCGNYNNMIKSCISTNCIGFKAKSSNRTKNFGSFVTTNR